MTDVVDRSRFTSTLCALCARSYDNETRLFCHYISEHPGQFTLTPILDDLHEGARTIKPEHGDGEDGNSTLADNESEHSVTPTSTRKRRTTATVSASKRAKLESPTGLYRCTQCDDARRFETAADLGAHEKEWHGQTVIQKCAFCDRTFGNLTALTTHQRSGQCSNSAAHATRPHRHNCAQCSRVFENSIALATHIRDDHIVVGAEPPILYTEEFYSTRGHRCGMCPKAYSTRTHLNRHVAREHRSIGHPDAVAPSELTCNVDGCWSVFTTKRNLVRHQSNVHRVKAVVASLLFTEKYYKGRPFRCEHCPRSYTSRSSLKVHYKTNHVGVMGATTGESSCDDGRPMATTSSAALVHNYTDAYYVQRPFKCTQCPIAFSAENWLGDHMTAVHEADAPPPPTLTVVAIEPTATTDDTDNLTTDAGDATTIECKKCQQSFDNQKDLLAHYNALHRFNKDYYEQRAFRCAQCPRAFTFESTKLNHMRKDHNIGEDGGATTCTSMVMTEDQRGGNVTDGVPEHQGERQYKCPKSPCKKTCLSRHGLANHIRLKHGSPTKRAPRVEVKPKSATPSTLADRTCTTCAKVFTDSWKCRRHMKGVHGIKLVPTASTPTVALHAEPEYTEEYYVTRQFKCDECPRAYKHANSLATHHMQAHGTRSQSLCPPTRCESRTVVTPRKDDAEDVANKGDAEEVAENGAGEEVRVEGHDTTDEDKTMAEQTEVHADVEGTPADEGEKERTPVVDEAVE